MKTTKTKFIITTTNINTGTEYLVCRVVGKGDALNILDMLNQKKPDYLTYKLK